MTGNVKTIYGYLGQHPGQWLDEVVMAAELQIAVPVLKHHLAALANHCVERGDDDNWRVREIEIDSEFKSLIPPLSQEERSQLETNLLNEGCKSAQ